MSEQFRFGFNDSDPIVEESEYDTQPSLLEEMETLKEIEQEQEDSRFIPPRNLWERPKVTIKLQVKTE